ncbi:crAss001_48 related protein [Intestinibacter sp.]|uniref:crAss001_48 related protein n=1 Tax=Intestinibacter sp. TaxID=1965304 RepID=UPI003F185D85
MNQETFDNALNEFNELNTKITKLREFLLGDKVKELNNLNHDLLIAQLKAMEAYASVLSIRLGLNAPREEESAE